MNHKDVKKEIFANRPDVEEEYKKKDIVSDISNMIIRARIKRGLTQTELAEKAGLKQPSIARIESEEHAPNLNTLSKLAHALDLKLDVRLKDSFLSETSDSSVEISYDKETRTYRQSQVENFDDIKKVEFAARSIINSEKISDKSEIETVEEKTITK